MRWKQWIYFSKIKNRTSYVNSPTKNCSKSCGDFLQDLLPFLGLKIANLTKTHLLKPILSQKVNAYVSHKAEWIWLKFKREIIRVSHRWRSGRRSGWHEIGQWSKPRHGNLIFDQISYKCGDNKNFATINSKYSKKSPLSTLSSLEDSGVLRAKVSFFSAVHHNTYIIFF